MPGEDRALSGQWQSYLSLDYLTRATQRLGGKGKKKEGEENRGERERVLSTCCCHNVTMESERHPAASLTLRFSLSGTM